MCNPVILTFHNLFPVIIEYGIYTVVSAFDLLTTWATNTHTLFLLLLLPFILSHSSGDLIDIGWGQKMFIRCSQGKGKLTVVLDTPVGETSDVWSRVEPMISKYARVRQENRRERESKVKIDRFAVIIF